MTMWALNKTKLVGPLASAMLIAATLSGCGAPEGSEGDKSQTQDPFTVHPDSCANGITPGCGTCAPDPASPRGGYQTCWTCESNYRQVCDAPPSFNATWSATANVWNDAGQPQKTAQVQIPITFSQYGNDWYMYIKSFSTTIGLFTVSLKNGQYGSGKVYSATGGGDLQLPLTVSSSLATFDVTIPVSTSGSITPPGSGTLTGSNHDVNGNLGMVGTGVSSFVVGAGNIRFWLSLSGKISNWPIFSTSFEGGTSDWTTWANCEADNSWSAGSYYTATDNPAPLGGAYDPRLHTTKFAPNCSFPGVYALSPPAQAFAGVTYRVQSQVRNAALAGTTFLLFFDSAGNELGGNSVSWAADAWRFNADPTLTAVAPANTASLRVRYGLNAADGFADIDLVQVDSQ
jgi:hypothetical protein